MWLRALFVLHDDRRTESNDIAVHVHWIHGASLLEALHRAPTSITFCSFFSHRCTLHSRSGRPSTLRTEPRQRLWVVRYPASELTSQPLQAIGGDVVGYKQENSPAKIRRVDVVGQREAHSAALGRCGARWDEDRSGAAHAPRGQRRAPRATRRQAGRTGRASRDHTPHGPGAPLKELTTAHRPAGSM